MAARMFCAVIQCLNFMIFLGIHPDVPCGFKGWYPNHDGPDFSLINP